MISERGFYAAVARTTRESRARKKTRYEKLTLEQIHLCLDSHRLILLLSHPEAFVLEMNHFKPKDIEEWVSFPRSIFERETGSEDETKGEGKEWKLERRNQLTSSQG